MLTECSRITGSGIVNKQGGRLVLKNVLLFNLFHLKTNGARKSTIITESIKNKFKINSKKNVDAQSKIQKRRIKN